MKKEYFSSRLGFILSLLGIAVGAGNIWRFARVVAQNGGGSFIIPWVIFLFIWSIPLILAEIAMGKLTRKGPIGALAMTAGPSYGWMGAFIALVTTGILFYYSVIVGWGIRYFFYGLSGHLVKSDPHLIWQQYIQSFQPLLFHILAVIIGGYIIYKGVTKGIERINKILIPLLLGIILLIAIRAFTLPGGLKGISYLFTPNFTLLKNYKIWIEALTQNAWDTGAGWGLFLVYAGYIKQKESITVNGCLTAFANNAVSLLMAMIIFSTAFAIQNVSGIQSLIQGEGSTNTGLAFIYLPLLFQQLPGGIYVQDTFATIFFLAFAAAALSSMISMLLLTTQVFQELGLKKTTALTLTVALAIIFGAPSALNMAIFDNQDWVWSLGLIVNGLFIAFGVARFGTDKFRKEAINTVPGDFKLKRFYNFIIGVLVPVQGIVLIGWYLYQSLIQTTQWWNPVQITSIGTLLLQWGLPILVFLLINKKLVKQS